MNNIHSVTDKALYDALCQSRVTSNELRELFLDRGIIISKKTDKKELAKNFSKLNHDYYVHQRIASIFGNFMRKEKTTSLVIKNSIDKSLLLEAANKLKNEIEFKDDLCHIISDKSAIKIHITYLSTNYGKSDFNQVEKKTAIFEIEPIDSGYSIRRPNNEQTSNYEEIFLSKIEQLTKLKSEEDGNDPSSGALIIDEISMENIDDPEKRTDFFKKLINGLEGYDLDDVTDAFVYHPKPKIIEEEDGDADTGVHISKASLKGQGVLKSEELTSLYERGFYIWKIRWRVIESAVDPDILEFEAQFNEPLEFRDFSYISRGIKRYKTGGVYNKNPTKLSEKQELYFNQLIEKTARSIIMEINEGYK